ncbi:MAG TPA: alpha/beta hydrolase-fold protein [Phycisphaerae bacterium]|nr:alpha/beta hydrolase-fold protein [Phycisphaerae bacterium]
MMAFMITCISLVMPGPGKVSIELAVTAPADTNELFVSGSTPQLGPWKADALKATLGPDGRFHATIQAQTGTVVEFKFTRGSWETVEKDEDGADIPNRRLKVSESAKYEYTVHRWADSGQPIPPQPKKTPKHSLTGDIRFHEEFPSKFLHDARSLIVYLPPDYKDNADRRYPVLYMHDGQNLFDAATSFMGIEWQADETAQRLIKSKKIPAIIIVGIYNTPQRMNDYTPTRDAKKGIGGKGGDYTRFVIEKVKPFIDRTYRTKPDARNTAVAGSSLGGLISLDMAYRHPNTFSKCGVISPALMWDDSRLLKEIEKNPAPLKGVRLWIDMGTAEGDNLVEFKKATDATRRLAEALRKAGFKDGKDFKYAEIEGGHHNEADWARRLEEILTFLFQPQS